MVLAIAEKEHWHERISREVDQAIEQLVLAENPTFLQELQVEARKAALVEMGLLELSKRYEQALNDLKRLELEVDETRAQMFAIVRGQRVHWVFHYQNEVVAEIERSIIRRAQAQEAKLLSQSELGRKVLKLRTEKEELLDTVWLATSGRQIKELWTSLSELLSHSPTPLQAVAIKIASDPEST